MVWGTGCEAERAPAGADTGVAAQHMRKRSGGAEGTPALRGPGAPHSYFVTPLVLSFSPFLNPWLLSCRQLSGIDPHNNYEHWLFRTIAELLICSHACRSQGLIYSEDF